MRWNFYVWTQVEVMKCLISKHMFLFGLPNPILSIREIVVLCMGESEILYLRLWSHEEQWSRSWHGWFLVQGFLIPNSFYNDIFVEVHLKRFGRREKVVALFANTSMFVPNDRSQCPFSVLPIMWCAACAHLDVGLAERPTPCRFIETGFVSFPCFREDGRLLIRQIRSECPFCDHSLR